MLIEPGHAKVEEKADNVDCDTSVALSKCSSRHQAQNAVIASFVHDDTKEGEVKVRIN